MILFLVFGPLAAGLCCLLFQRGLRTVPVFTYLVSMVMSLYVLASGRSVTFELLDSFGVKVLLDQAAAWFILLNALVSIAVAWHERYRGRHHYFFILLAFLHGCVNACFISHDLFNLYVVIELTTITAFLLIGQGMTTRHLWNALRYIFLSNVGMLFFLLGTLLVYESSGGFSFEGVVQAPPTARAMIIAGLLVKGGVFLPGLWLPKAHAEADAAVSALLSGVVVNIGLLPLIRLETYSPDILFIIQCMGVGGVFTGLLLAVFQRDIKRLLACSTISQVSFILLTPVVGPIYAFAHGIAKASLFLCAGSLPERDLFLLREKKAPGPLAVPMVLAALSITGFPLLIGFAAKNEVTYAASGWIQSLIIPASIGTAIIMAPIILMPQRSSSWKESPSWQSPVFLGITLLVSSLFSGLYSPVAWLKSLIILVVGLVLHRFAFRRLSAVELPGGWEKLEHVVGMICVALVMVVLGVYFP